MHDELAPMNVAQMMDRAVWAYKKSFWKQLAFAAVVFVVFTVVVTFIVIGFIVAFALGFIAYDSAFGIIVVLLAVFLPLIMLWLGISSTGHILFTRRALIGHLVHLPKLKVHVLAFRALTAIIAQGLVFLPLAILAVYLYYSSIVLIDEVFFRADFNMLGIILILIASALVVVAFLLVENIFALSVAAAMFEGRLFFGALIRSWELVRDEYFRILATRVLWYMAGVGFALAAQGLMFLLMMLVGIAVGNLHPVFAVLLIPIGIVSAVFPFVVSVAQMPLDGIMRAVIYFNQLIKKEGMDIELRLNMIWQKGMHNGVYRSF